MEFQLNNKFNHYKQEILNRNGMYLPVVMMSDLCIKLLSPSLENRNVLSCIRGLRD
jgi:hypothetical protein